MKQRLVGPPVNGTPFSWTKRIYNPSFRPGGHGTAFNWACWMWNGVQIDQSYTEQHFVTPLGIEGRSV